MIQKVNVSANSKDVRLAQLDRASGYGPEGRGFESSSARDESGKALQMGFLVLTFRYNFYTIGYFIVSKI